MSILVYVLVGMAWAALNAPATVRYPIALRVGGAALAVVIWPAGMTLALVSVAVGFVHAKSGWAPRWFRRMMASHWRQGRAPCTTCGGVDCGNPWNLDERLTGFTRECDNRDSAIVNHVKWTHGRWQSGEPPCEE